MPFDGRGLLAAEFDYVRNLAQDKAAIVLGDDKRYLVESRLSLLAEKDGFQSLGALISALRQAQDFGVLHAKAIDALATHETLFFRDRHPFDALADTVLPQLIHARKELRRINIWCAAASSGQEPYSIAMLIREKFPELCSWKISILGTDLSEAVLSQARAGTYSQIEVNRGLPADYLAKYFSHQTGERWTIRPEIRAMVQFRSLNLIGDWANLPVFDLIFIRNVLIYFDVNRKREVLVRIASRLAPDGFMALGSAETPMLLTNKFRPCLIGRAQFYQLVAV